MKEIIHSKKAKVINKIKADLEVNSEEANEIYKALKKNREDQIKN